MVVQHTGIWPERVDHFQLFFPKLKGGATYRGLDGLGRLRASDSPKKKRPAQSFSVGSLLRSPIGLSLNGRHLQTFWNADATWTRPLL